MKKYLVSLFAYLFAFNAFAVDGGFRTADEILNGDTGVNTECSTGVFANALTATANNISENDDEQTIQQWIHQTFADSNVLSAVLRCPEFASAENTEHIHLQPIQYVFPGGREIVVNYETQPQILKQRIIVANKRDINNINDISPKIGEINDNSVWTNTDPAWYAIMVTQHGALDDFVGPDKNNTISLQYIKDNVNWMYPNGAMCTSKTAIANDNDIINKTLHETVNIEDDTNDYYVAGDANLQWLSYAEIAADVVLTVATMGGGVWITGATKSARASRIFKNLSHTMRGLNYSETLNRLRRYQQLEKELAVLDKTRDAVKYAEKFAELEKIQEELRTIDKITDTAKYADKLNELEKISQAVHDYIKMEDQIARSKRTIERIQKYKELEKEIATLDKTRDAAQYAEKMKNFDKVARELRDVDKLTTMTPQQAKRLADLDKNEARIIAAQQKSPSARQAQDLRRQLNSVRQERNQIMNNVSLISDTEMTAKIEELEKEIAQISEEMAEAVKNDKNIAEYARAKKSLTEISEYAKAYKNLKRAQTGNVVARAWRAARATADGNKTMNKAARIARHSMKSGRTRDWLFNSTMRNLGKLGRLETATGALFSVVSFAADMYDWTETSTDEYTNGIEFEPLLLLSADDLAGQENVVNHGMWLLWQGNSTDSSDDDAAYLQAMDFAEKFHMDLIETMQAENNHACDVDIYVVHPVLRNPDTNPEMYYLIMNDEPWTTAE